MRGSAARPRPATTCPRRENHRTPRRPTAKSSGAYTLLCENSFSTGTPTLWRAREAQSRWKNSST